MHIVFKLQDASYQRALKRAIYFLNYNDIIFYFWDENKEYDAIGHQNIILLVDGPVDEETASYPHCHRIHRSTTPTLQRPMLHMDMTIDALVQVLKDHYRNQECTTTEGFEIHMVTGNHGGVGKSSFAAACARLAGDSSCWIELFDPCGDSELKLQELVWQWHERTIQPEQSETFDYSVPLAQMPKSDNWQRRIRGFSNWEDINQLDALWLMGALKAFGPRYGLTRIWLTLPHLLIPAAKELVTMADVHWHLVDVSRLDGDAMLQYWRSNHLVLPRSNVVTIETHPMTLVAKAVDIPHDPFPAKARMDYWVEALLRREGGIGD